MIMTTVIEARSLTKRYGATLALDHVSFSVEPGRILGIIGPNGAGKTTALKAVLGLTPFEGELSVLGRNPRSERDRLMQDVCFIADVAVLPRWLRVSQALEFVAGVHPRFDRARAEDFLRKTDIRSTSRVRELSKGMVTQLHLALILAIDARLLVLDEPTLGLDLLYRRQFYDTLVNDYFDKERTILLTTHQVEEIEHLLTDVIFLAGGHITLSCPVETLAQRYLQVNATTEQAARARQLKPFYEREVFGRVALFFEGRAASELAPFGEVRTPTIADLFVAQMQREAHASPGGAQRTDGGLPSSTRDDIA
jgi:ABC-2 type transport system ATP-binding protein